MADRIDKILATITPYSRAELKRLARKKKVLQGEKILTDLSEKITLDRATFVVNEEVYQFDCARQHLYIALHKAAGVLSTKQDSHRPTVIDSVLRCFSKDEKNMQVLKHTETLQICGRLDVDTTGLILLTTDGAWNHHITSPRHCTEKEYQVELAKPIYQNDLQRLSDGLELSDGPARAASVTQIDKHNIRITLTEGRHHQVKRMAHAIGNEVSSLHRLRIGGLVLDSAWPEGDAKVINPEIIDQEFPPRS